ncbi:MAG: hypothetical protein K0R87_2698 [Pseudonocardia sp.]|nr:hypothetical protein [Pseudonocardia sp.]
MDLRLAVFERLAGDDVLRRLLVNYADRLDDRVGTNGPASDTCYLTVEWSAGDRADAPPDAESVLVRAHMPRSRAEEHWYLDVVLRRLDAALDLDGTNGPVQIMRRRTSTEVIESGADTIFKARSYDVALLPERSALPFPVDPGTIGSAPPDGATPGRR